MEPSDRIPSTIIPWQPAATIPQIAPDEAHVWCLDLSAPVSLEAKTTLSKDEIAAANRFHFDRDRNRYIACRTELRRILGHLTQTPPAHINFGYTSHGKPYLSPNNLGLRFNVSHSKNTALIAIAKNHDVGVDIEYVETDIDHAALAKRFFTHGERHHIASLDIPQQPHGFYQCWTRKEAWIKAVGGGLSLPLDQFDVTASLSNTQATLRDSQTQTPWRIFQLLPHPQTVAAMVTAPSIKIIYQWQCPSSFESSTV